MTNIQVMNIFFIHYSDRLILASWYLLQFLSILQFQDRNLLPSLIRTFLFWISMQFVSSFTSASCSYQPFERGFYHKRATLFLGYLQDFLFPSLFYSIYHTCNLQSILHINIFIVSLFSSPYIKISYNKLQRRHSTTFHYYIATV